MLAAVAARAALPSRGAPWPPRASCALQGPSAGSPPAGPQSRGPCSAARSTVSWRQGAASCLQEGRRCIVQSTQPVRQVPTAVCSIHVLIHKPLMHVLNITIQGKKMLLVGCAHLQRSWICMYSKQSLQSAGAGHPPHLCCLAPRWAGCWRQRTPSSCWQPR